MADCPKAIARGPQHRLIRYFGRMTTLSCDGRCDLAWGTWGGRRYIDDVPLTDAEMLAAVGPAPVDPGTTEGGDRKPGPIDPALNKWCARNCERSEIGPYERSFPATPQRPGQDQKNTA